MGKYYSTGITVDYGYAGNDKMGWTAKCGWQDGKFAENGTMVGSIQTKYYENSISEAIDYVLDTMKEFNIKQCSEIMDMNFALFRENEDKSIENSTLEIMKQEALNRNWDTCL